MSATHSPWLTRFVRERMRIQNAQVNTHAYVVDKNRANEPVPQTVLDRLSHLTDVLMGLKPPDAFEMEGE